MAAYATPAQLLARYDARRIGDLVADPAPGSTTSRVSPTALLTDVNLAAALGDAAGMIDSAILKGGRYTPQDLADLAALSSGADNSYQLLIRVNCDLAYGLLIRRRGLKVEDSAPGYLEALQTLQRLSDGDLVFNLSAVIAAGRMTTHQLDLQIGLLSANVRRYFGDLDTAATNPNNPQRP